MDAFTRRNFLIGAAATALGSATVALTGCAPTSPSTTTSTASSASATMTRRSVAFDAHSWKYDEINDVYYQLGRSYVAKPAAPDYETLGIFVPGKYLTATKNSDGTYAATLNQSGMVGSFTAGSAPIVFPVNTPRYAAQKPLTTYSYNDVSAFLEAGFVYVHAGLRGKDSQTDKYTGNAPWGVTDLKSAVRYLRCNADLVPSSKNAVFVFGHSGGGAQSAVMGSSGDNELYNPYLDAIGAATVDNSGNTISDVIAGAMCWCPITNLDWANAAYEWNMGQFATSGTRTAGTWTKAYSTDLAEAFGGYINELSLKTAAGEALNLEKSSSGHYLSGSYYDYVVSVIETSLNNFLSDTAFPYTPSNSQMAGMGGSAPSGSGGSAPSGAPSGATPGGAPSDASGGSQQSSSSTTYQTVTEYMNHLNSDSTWVDYDASTKTATVKSLAGFVASQKPATKDVGAFDAPDRSATENVVMSLKTAGLHFAQISEQVIAANEGNYAKLTGWKEDYGSIHYTSDFAETDSVGKVVLDRVDMYNPLYYLSDHYKGRGTSTVASHWRIRTGIMQGDTANTTEINLALALSNLGIKNVDFATVWGMGHTMVERTGDATTNFIDWVRARLVEPLSRVSPLSVPDPAAFPLVRRIMAGGTDSFVSCCGQPDIGWHGRCSPGNMNSWNPQTFSPASDSAMTPSCWPSSTLHSTC